MSLDVERFASQFKRLAAAFRATIKDETVEEYYLQFQNYSDKIFEDGLYKAKNRYDRFPSIRELRICVDEAHLEFNRKLDEQYKKPIPIEKLTEADIQAGKVWSQKIRDSFKLITSRKMA